MRTSFTVRFLFVLAIFYPALHFVFIPFYDPDLWWHLKTGEYLLTNFRFPEKDPFSFTASQPWRIYAWLPEICFYWIHSRFGFWGLKIFFLLFLLLFGWKFWNFLFSIHPRPTLCFVFTLLTSLMLITVSGPRPQFFGNIFLGWLILTLMEREKGEKNNFSFWRLPLLFLFWANCHISFPLGLALLWIYIFSKTWPLLLDAPVGFLFKNLSFPPPRTYFQTETKNFSFITSGFASLLACLANPYGWNIFAEYKVQFQEWLWKYIAELSPPTSQLFVCNLFYLFLGLCMVWLTLWGKQMRFWEWLFVLLSLVLPFFAVKFLPVPFLVALPVLYSHGNFAKFTSAENFRFAPVFNLLLGVIVLLSIGRSIFKSQRKDSPFPESAVNFLKQQLPHQQGNMANHYNQGGYLLWSLWPKRKVFIDGRAQLFSQHFLQYDYAALMLEPEAKPWREVLDTYQIELVLWPNNHPLVFVLDAAGWKKIYSDKKFSIFQRPRS